MTDGSIVSLCAVWLFEGAIAPNRVCQSAVAIMDDRRGISIKYRRKRFARSIHYGDKWLSDLTRVTTACPHASVTGTILGKEEHAQFGAVDTGFEIRW